MGIKLTILGFNSALPKVRANPTAQLLEIANKLFLIDCGEGTQVQIRRSKAKFSKIDHIFISHLHGDHVFGLPGLLSTFSLLGRKKELNIYGPVGIKEFVEGNMRLSGMVEIFPFVFHELDVTKTSTIFQNDKVIVQNIPLSHRVPTNGYLFKEKVKPRKINKDSIKKYPDLAPVDYHSLKLGKDFVTDSGKVIPNEKLTLDPPKSFSYAFCSDTKYRTDIVPIIKNVDILYHESTFLHQKIELAKKTGHSTALQAAMIAKAANVGKLILGHFSNRYNDYEEFEKEAQKEFENVELPKILKEYILE